VLYLQIADTKEVLKNTAGLKQWTAYFVKAGEGVLEGDKCQE
jgi:hypothetical protein